MKNKLLIIILIGLMQSCVSKKEILYMQDVDAYNQSELTYLSTTLQPNDILKISVGALVPETALPYNRFPSTGQGGDTETMKLEGYLVSLDQTITFPVLGVLSVKDKTPGELEQDLRRKLEEGGHLVSPSVAVRLLNAKVTLLGEVNSPGTYTFTESNVTLLQAIGLAGDLTIYGKRDDVVLIREVDGVRTVAHLDLTTANWLNSPYQVVQPNDVIIVNQNPAKVTSAGFIANIGTLISVTSVVLSMVILLTR